jgi:hypothetical protein
VHGKFVANNETKLHISVDNDEDSLEGIDPATIIVETENDWHIRRSGHETSRLVIYEPEDSKKNFKEDYKDHKNGTAADEENNNNHLSDESVDIASEPRCMRVAVRKRMKRMRMKNVMEKFVMITVSKKKIATTATVH